MIKLRKIKFDKHPILGDLSLDFTLPDGKAADIIILAGENGSGKSTILNEIFNLPKNLVHNTVHTEEEGEECTYMPDETRPDLYIWKHSSKGKEKFVSYNLSGIDMKSIYADVSINYDVGDISSITSLELDRNTNSERMRGDAATKIEQLLIDINNQDANDFADRYEQERDAGRDISNMVTRTRMQRFNRAFKKIFNDICFKTVKNDGSRKIVLFEKQGELINIRNLSSGEKQIIYRACFLLQNVNSTRGAFILIDEPEMSLHPDWQKQILQFYKSLYTDDEGLQTSQMFVVTHSPFVIHAANGGNLKVIVLKRNGDGIIESVQSPEYYACESKKTIEDAFNIRDFSNDQPTIYLAGRTDVKYFEKALSLSGIVDFPFCFKWVGYIDDKGQERNTGDDALHKAFQFLIGRRPNCLNICLFDCDANQDKVSMGNVIKKGIPKFQNELNISAGIENSLVLENDVYQKHVSQKNPKYNAYNLKTETQELDKMGLCNHICSELDVCEQKKVFANLFDVLNSLKDVFNNS